VRRARSLVPLSHQHHNGLAFCVLAERALRSDSGDANVRAWARKAIDRYEIELVNHFDIEERILFPAAPMPLVDTLVAEHRQLESLIGRLRQTPSLPLIMEFTALLRRHIRCEEEQYFESVQKLLDHARLEDLGAQIEEKVIRVCL